MPLPSLQPLPLQLRPQLFSDPDWRFEIKYDGFRALAHIAESIAFVLLAKNAVLDGEIVCMDEKGHSQFNELLFHRGTPRFCRLQGIS